MSATPLELYSAYLDGHSLSDAQVLQLRAWVGADPANAEELVRFGAVHAAIADRLVLGRLLEELATHSLSIISPEALAEAMRDIEATSPRAASAAIPAAARFHEPAASLWATPLAVAAAVVIVLLGAWALRTASAPTLGNPTGDQLSAGQQALANANSHASAPKIVEKPVVAVVGPVFDAQWTFGKGNASGDPLREGARLDLLDGIVQLDMVSGVAVVLEGPCHVELQGPTSLQLSDGKAAARIEGVAKSFVINTPSAQVTDLGTEFGVEATPAGETLVSVYDGSVEVAQAFNDAATAARDGGTNGQLRIDAGYEISVARLAGGKAEFGQPLEVKNPRAFIRPDEVDVRVRAARGSLADQKLAAHYARLRMEGVLAYQGFDAASAGANYVKGFGPQGIMSLASVNCVEASRVDGSRVDGSQENASQGFAGMDVQGGDAFLMFDASGGGPFARAGMIGPTGLIGQSGSELWMSWQTQRYSVDAESDDSAGLSLMFGDRNNVDEPLFVGHAAAGGVFCVQSAWGDGPPPAGKRVTSQVDFDASTPGVQSRLIDDKPHAWIMRIRFADDHDRVSVWVDAEPSTLNASAPQAVLDVSTIEFDRVRLASHRGTEVWRYGQLAAGRDLESLAAIARVESASVGPGGPSSPANLETN